MEKRELCLECKELGYCRFEKDANRIADGVPPVEEQTPINPDSKVTEDVAAAFREISDLRSIARKRNCPQINEVDPDYHGKINLLREIQNILSEKKQRQEPKAGTK